MLLSLLKVRGGKKVARRKRGTKEKKLKGGRTVKNLKNCLPSGLSHGGEERGVTGKQ